MAVLFRHFTLSWFILAPTRYASFRGQQKLQNRFRDAKRINSVLARFCLGRQCDSLFYRSLFDFREQRNIQNTVFCEESFGRKESRLIRLFHIQRCGSFSKRVGPRVILLENLPNKQNWCSFSQVNNWEIYQFKLRKLWQKAMITDLKTNSDTIEKIKKRRKQPEFRRWGQQHACNMDKEDTQLKQLEHLSVTLLLNILFINM